MVCAVSPKIKRILIMTYKYTPHGVCSRLITIELADDDTIESVQFIGGCSGNLQGIGRLVSGMKAEDAVAKLENIRCGSKGTSCPDQLAKALKEVLEER